MKRIKEVLSPLHEYDMADMKLQTLYRVVKCSTTDFEGSYIVKLKDKYFMLTNNCINGCGPLTTTQLNSNTKVVEIPKGTRIEFEV